MPIRTLPPLKKGSHPPRPPFVGQPSPSFTSPGGGPLAPPPHPPPLVVFQVRGETREEVIKEELGKTGGGSLGDRDGRREMGDGIRDI